MAVAVAAFILSTAFWITMTLGLVAMIIILCAACTKVPRCALVTASVFAFICSVFNFLINAIVSDSSMCGGDDEEDNNSGISLERDRWCKVDALRSAGFVAGVLWIVAGILALKIPNHDKTDSPNASTKDSPATNGATLTLPAVVIPTVAATLPAAPAPQVERHETTIHADGSRTVTVTTANSRDLPSTMTYKDQGRDMNSVFPPEQV
jgi:hypothetical protein